MSQTFVHLCHLPICHRPFSRSANCLRGPAPACFSLLVASNPAVAGKDGSQATPETCRNAPAFVLAFSIQPSAFPHQPHVKELAAAGTPGSRRHIYTITPTLTLSSPEFEFVNRQKYDSNCLISARTRVFSSNSGCAKAMAQGPAERVNWLPRTARRLRC